MWERGYRLELEELYEEECIAWFAAFTSKNICNNMDPHILHGWNGDTAPEAIVRAALAVLDGDALRQG